MRRTTVYLAAAALLSITTLHGASSIGDPKPDLALDPPTITLVGSIPRVTASWNVRNAGTVATAATHLEVRCTPVYFEEMTLCEPTKLIDIPPLAKGDHFVAAYVVAAYKSPKPSLQKYRFTLSARVDPNNLIAESNEQNNAVNFTAENFQGLPPSHISESPAAPLAAPIMQLVTNPATWDPTKSTWIEVKNIGPYDAPALSVAVTCYKASHSAGITNTPNLGPQDERPCDSVVSASPHLAATTAVQAIAKGQFKAIYELKAFIPPASNSHEPVYLPEAVRFHLVGANCPDLLLSNKPK